MKSKSTARTAAKKPHHRTLMGMEQRARTKAKIVTASIKVFAKKGPYLPVIDDFVKAAGIARGTFYYYFSTVEEVKTLAIDVVVSRHATEVSPVIGPIENPLFRFATGVRLFQRRAILDPIFAALMSSDTSMAKSLETTARRDIQLAIDQRLIELNNVDAAYSIAVAMNQYAARFSKKSRPEHLSGTEVARAILYAWGTQPALLEAALSIPLPAVKTLRLF